MLRSGFTLLGTGCHFGKTGKKTAGCCFKKTGKQLIVFYRFFHFSSNFETNWEKNEKTNGSILTQNIKVANWKKLPGSFYIAKTSPEHRLFITRRTRSRERNRSSDSRRPRITTQKKLISDANEKTKGTRKGKGSRPYRERKQMHTRPSVIKRYGLIQHIIILRVYIYIYI